MKKLITILSLLVSILLGCSSKEENKEEVSKAPPTQKQEIVKKEAPLEVNYKTLRRLINGGKLIPLDFYEGNDLFSRDSSLSTRIYLLIENDEIMLGEVYLFEKVNRSSYSTYIGVFSKEDGKLKSYLISKDKASSDNDKSKKFFGFEEKDNLIKFAMLEPVTIDSLEQSANELRNRKILFTVNKNGEILATDTLDHLRHQRFKEFIGKFRSKQDVSEYQQDDFYPRFDEVSVQEVNYFNTIYTSDDILVFRVRWSISDQTLESIWVYTVYGEFKSSCEAIYPFEDYGVKIKSEKFEVEDEKNVQIKISIDWEQYDLIADDEAGFYFGDKYVGKGEWNLYIADDYTCSLIEENVTKEKVNFLDFIEKFKNEKDISKYQGEPYYGKFAEISIQSVNYVETIYQGDNLVVLRANWSISDYNMEEVWVFNSVGEFKSSCDAIYPYEEYGVEIKESNFEVVNKENVEISINSKWRKYEVIPYEDDYGFELGDYEDKQGKWILKIDDNYKCSFEEVEI
jgi:hypothetical protein